METRRDESKKEGNYKGFCQSFYSGVREVKRTITRPFVLSSAWLLLSNTVMAKTNISSTVIMQYILHLIRASKAGPKQPLSAFWLADKHQLVSSFETTAWMLISVSVIHTYNYKISNKLFVHVNTGGFLLFSQINFDALCLWKAGRRTHTKLWQIDIIQYLAFVRVLFITLSLVRCGFHGSDGLYVGINGTVSDLSGLLYPGTHGDVLIEVWLWGCEEVNVNAF